MTQDEIVAKRIEESDNLDQLAFILRILFKQNAVDENGELYSIRALVDYTHGLRIEIYANEHQPPHFHVRSADLNASFTIDDCRLIQGSIGGRERRIIEWWHKRSKKKLVWFWNEMRPADCPVGPVHHDLPEKKFGTKT